MERLLENLINLFGMEMPELTTVDEDYGQLEMINQENRDTYPLTYPAVLIDAPDVNWSNIAGLSQKGIATIRFTNEDIVRHPLVTKIVRAFDKKAEEQA